MKHFKFKDVFTLANLFLSFFSVILMFSGKFEEASYIILINILILDILDGLVARITKTGNDFGKYFDSITDFVGSSVIVSYFIFSALSPTNYYLALVCGFAFLLTGVMRDVRSRLETVAHKGFFIGLPRNLASVLIVALFNSHLFAKYPLSAVLYLGILCTMQLSYAPYVGNHKPTLFAMPRVRNYLLVGIVYAGVHAYFGYFWDSMVTFMCGYLLSPYFLASPAVWEDIRRQRVMG
ncbi:MAG TPA: CDP-alcohol phosphatidyltransferase family protein [bacterium]|nr:CDP-alcohol phosphatidyltransferase family protein [bacterium]